MLILLPEDFKHRENPVQPSTTTSCVYLIQRDFYLDIPSLSLANVNKLTYYKQIYLCFAGGRQFVYV